MKISSPEDMIEYDALVAERDELRAENDRLKECAQQQAQGTDGCKTIRVELIPKGNRVACCVTFPSSFPDGEKTAAETAASMLALLYETANGLAYAQACPEPEAPCTSFQPTTKTCSG